MDTSMNMYSVFMNNLTIGNLQPNSPLDHMLYVQQILLKLNGQEKSHFHILTLIDVSG